MKRYAADEIAEVLLPVLRARLIGKKIRIPFGGYDEKIDSVITYLNIDVYGVDLYFDIFEDCFKYCFFDGKETYDHVEWYEELE